MDLLNRLKQAADFPTTEVSGESTWDDSTPKEEVIKLLQIAENELRQLRKQHEDLREESTEQIKEHGEYRAKVQGWRKQTQLDREASKNMIISLRGSDASKTDMDNSYIKNLHEQVTILKDNIRQSTEKAEKNANERDMLEKAWRDRFEKYNDEVEKWKTTLATTSDSPTQGEPSSADTLKLIQKENELETCNDLVKDLRSQLEESKKNLEESNAKAAGSIKQIQDIIESHERQINQLKAEQEVKLNSLQDGSQTKYIKDLETELKQWRQSSSTNVQDTSDEASSPVPSAVIVAGDEDLSKQLDREREEKKKLSADLCEALNRAASLETKIESSSARYLQIDSTSDAREQAIQSLFDENNQLRCEMEQKSIELSEAYSASDELQLRVTELLTEADKMNNSQSENFSELARLQKSTTTLQRELATRNETIRKLKTQSSKSGNTSQATAAPVKKRENVSSPTPPAADITTLIKQCVTQRRNELLECQRQLKIKYSDPNARGGL